MKKLKLNKKEKFVFIWLVILQEQEGFIVTRVGEDKRELDESLSDEKELMKSKPSSSPVFRNSAIYIK